MPRTTRSQHSLVASTTITEVTSTSRTLRKRKTAQDEPHEPTKRNSARTKKPAPSYLERSQEAINTDPNLNLRIFCLPGEIFNEIASHLSAPAEVCFSLTCKAALHAVGTTSWKRLGFRHDPVRTSLIQLLIQDVPGTIMCAICDTAHPPLRLPNAHRTTRLTKACYGQDAVIDYWPQTSSGGYSVLFVHIHEAFQSKPTATATATETSPPLESLAGDFTFTKDKVEYRMISSARWVAGSLILKHEHHLRHIQPRGRLRAVDVTSLPFCLCAHHTTNTAPPPESYYTRSDVSNSGLLTHAITAVFPPSLRTGVAPAKTFKEPTPGEKVQMTAAETDRDFVWRCRSCPTKFRVSYDGAHGGNLLVTSWHCFGKELYKAMEYWKYFVRREGDLLGPKKRNSEYYTVSRSLPDFQVE